MAIGRANIKSILQFVRYYRWFTFILATHVPFARVTAYNQISLYSTICVILEKVLTLPFQFNIAHLILIE